MTTILYDASLPTESPTSAGRLVSLLDLYDVQLYAEDALAAAGASGARQAAGHILRVCRKEIAPVNPAEAQRIMEMASAIRAAKSAEAQTAATRRLLDHLQTLIDAAVAALEEPAEPSADSCAREAMEVLA